mmetsp:Transcript_34171/g.73966  ORF Transcript_34171/g.73966 Transcript_34171/m.73966 type:complete len:590 (-) Transcript_34171:385-2154(-)
MQLILPSATIAIITGAACPPFVAAAASNAEEQVTVNDINKVVQDVDMAYIKSSTINKINNNINNNNNNSSNRLRQRTLEKECNSFPSSKKKKRGGMLTADVGILMTCDDEIHETCVPDETSSIGGRCTNTSSSSSSSSSIQLEQPQILPKVAPFKKRRNHLTIAQQQQRNLQILSDRPQTGDDGEEVVEGEEEVDVPFVCPTNCPIAFCDCAEDDGDAALCASELHDVCTSDLIPECVPDKYLPFYTETYCPFAQCLTEPTSGKPLYEECSCNYYLAYCNLYYSFEESLEKCAISTCCEERGAGEKFVCLPALEPTWSPTAYPTVSFEPSASPTSTTSPTATTGPTTTTAPTFAPSMSTSPTSSSAPSSSPSVSPTAYPTSSSKPTESPSESPTDYPTLGPTASPTALPSASPSYSPSTSPSNPPSTTLNPTVSLSPTSKPSTSQTPSITTNPSSNPTISAAPIKTPSLMPTQTTSPSSTPSTPFPTDNPTVQPTETPSGSPTSKPTESPTVPVPTTEVPTVPVPTTASPVADSNVVAEEKVQGATTTKIAADSSSGMAMIGPGGGRGGMAVAYSLFAGVGGALWLMFA